MKRSNTEIQTLKAFVLEDEKPVRRELVKTLKELGYDEVEEFRSAEKGIEAVKKCQEEGRKLPALCLVDLNLSDSYGGSKSGYRFIEFISFLSIPFVILTQYEEEFDKFVDEDKKSYAEFLDKDISEVNYTKSISRALGRLRANGAFEDTIDLMRDWRIFKARILWIRIDPFDSLRRVQICDLDHGRWHITGFTLSSFLDKENENYFQYYQQAHDSIIVNIAQIKELKGCWTKSRHRYGKIVFSDSSELPMTEITVKGNKKEQQATVSRRFFDQLKAAHQEYLDHKK
ncbi:MAG: hypothetical protein AAF740_03465 [Bacteroidota bacterium]